MPVLVSSGRARAALRCLVAALVSAALLVGFAAFLFWVFFQPGLVEFSVDSATVSDLSFTNTTVTGTFHLDIATYNPTSSVSVLYDRTKLLVLYDEEQLAAASHFQPQEDDESWLDVRAVAQSTPVTDTALQGIRRDVAAGNLPVNVLIRARLRFKVAGLTSWRFHLRAYCDNVVIDMSVPTIQDNSCMVEVY